MGMGTKLVRGDPHMYVVRDVYLGEMVFDGASNLPEYTNGELIGAFVGGNESFGRFNSFRPPRQIRRVVVYRVDRDGQVEAALQALRGESRGGIPDHYREVDSLSEGVMIEWMSPQLRTMVYSERRELINYFYEGLLRARKRAETENGGKEGG